MTELETERLRLQRFSLEDVDGFFELNNDPVVLKYTGDKPFDNKDQVAAFISDYAQYQLNGFGRWSLYLKETGEYLGFCGLRRAEPGAEVDIGFRIMRRHWRQGYALESAIAALQLGFGRYQLDRIVARAMEDNQASHAVINKLGMTRCGAFAEEGVNWVKYELFAPDVKR
ncbi:GNAT family N-acetyltransferase [Ferrimonas sp. YFM]|uniref:GNAT family N-acetyltransferase n=1 Tax=Ferrimonas sp. YFM TaxID=3028878 RepID=UPI00257420DC|nr:GNAT family N-acetyltransferase [Ferrimonas sp. YFM]BDY04492.1 N-acetyltransferase [Ferrimonas sp. YFM]